MRYIFILLFICWVSKAFTQAPFEGKITYTITSPRDKMSARLTTFFSNRKIRIEISDQNNPYEQDYVVLNLDSGKVFTLSPINKTYSVSLLQQNHPLISTVVNEIAGHKTTSVRPKASGNNFRLGGLLSYATLYVADDLFFPIPENYSGNELLTIVQNGKIVLGAKINTAGQFAAEMDTLEASQGLITIMADSVNRQNISANLFAIPPGYHALIPRRYSDNGKEAAIKDSLDSVASAMRRATPKSRSQKPLPKRKAPVKQPIRRREE